MAVEAKVGSFQLPAAHTSDTVVTGLGFAPNVLILLPSNATTPNSWRAEASFGIAALVRPLQGSTRTGGGVVCWHNDANATPRSVLSIGAGAHMRAGPTGDIAASGAITFDNDGFTIFWSDPFDSNWSGNQEYFAYLALGGDAIGAHLGGAGGFQLSTTAGVGAIQRMPCDLPFQPSGLFVAGQAPTSQSYAVSFGFQDDRHVAMSMQQDVYAPSFTVADPTVNHRRLDDGAILTLTKPLDGTVLAAWKVNTFRPDHVEFETVTAAAGGPWFCSPQVVALGGFGCRTGELVSPTAAGTQDISTGSTPVAALFMTAALPDPSTAGSHLRGSIGVTDGTNHRSVTWQSQSGVGTSNADTLFRNNAALVLADNATPAADLTLSDVDVITQGLRLTWA